MSGPIFLRSWFTNNLRQPGIACNNLWRVRTLFRCVTKTRIMRSVWKPRYRVDTEKLQKAVAKEFAAKRDKKTRVKPKARNQTAA